jgi:hypothetical protein
LFWKPEAQDAFADCKKNPLSLHKDTPVILGSTSKLLGNGDCTVVICQSCYTAANANSSSRSGRSRKKKQFHDEEEVRPVNASAASVDWKQCPCQGEECRLKWEVTQDVKGIKKYKRFSGCEDIMTYCCKQHYGALFS